MTAAIQVAEKPILFSGAMVRAILEGRKTQTRRVVSPQNCRFGSGPSCMWKHGNFSKAWIDGKKSTCEYLHVPLPDRNIDRCDHLGYGGSAHRLWPMWWPKDAYCGPEKERPPYRLWVRETWNIDSMGGMTDADSYEHNYEVRYKADDARKEFSISGPRDIEDPYIRYYDTQRGEWRPSIHMPRWASRLRLEIVNVRVERLQEISEADILAEGIDGAFREDLHLRSRAHREPRPIEAFAYLWDSINSKRDGGKYAWAANPWVWVIEFKRVSA